MLSQGDSPLAQPIALIGIGADGLAGLRADCLNRVHDADFLAGGDRHLAMVPQSHAERFVIKNNLVELGAELRRRVITQRCVVLASGDPLFFGIGTFLLENFGSAALRIEPAVSSMQLAFARAGVVWHEAALASVHGRESRQTLLPLLGRRTIGIFTQDGDSPTAVAQFFFEHGLGTYRAMVGEHLGSPQEQIHQFEELSQLAGRRFEPLNYLVLQRTIDPEEFGEVERRRALVPGIPDEEFSRPTAGPEVMTRQEVRAVTVAQLLKPLSPGDVLWDVGAGLGTIGIECAVLRPAVEVIAVESNSVRTVHLWQNRERFGAYNIRIVEGRAPEVLEEVPDPTVVFLGGSGSQLAAIVEVVAERLRPGGRLVANFVTLEHFMYLNNWLTTHRWPTHVTELQVARSDALAGLTGLKPQRGVFIIRADKPDA